MEPDIEALRERLLIDALTAAWSDANWRYFRRALTLPVLRIADTRSTLGSYAAEDRTLTLSRSLVRESPWAKIVEVLHHEMAHQYVAEVLGVHDETAHGPAFRRVLEGMGADDHAERGANEPAILGKVRKLLALAGSPNRHEAEAAMKAAHRLMLAHNVDIARTRAASGVEARIVGEPRTRHDAWEKLLFALLAQHFFVRVVWITDLDTRRVVRQRNGRAGFARRTAAECLGTPSNLEIAQWVYDFVLATGARMWADHKARRGVKGDRDRRRYLAGLVTGFRQRLGESAAACAAEGLVWLGDAAVDDLVARRHPRLVRNPVRVAGGEAFRHGQADGRRLVLHRPIRTGGDGGGQLTG